MRRVAGIMVVVVLVVALGSQARAQAKYDMKRFEAAVGVTTLKEHGFGLAARVLGPVGLEVSAGYQPWLVMVMGACEIFDLMMKLQAEADLLIRLVSFQNDRMKMVLKLGGGWMEDMDYFGKGGVGFDLYLSKNFFFDFAAGLMIVPGAYDFVVDLIDAEEDCSNALSADKESAGVSATIQVYVGVNGFLRF